MCAGLGGGGPGLRKTQEKCWKTQQMLRKMRKFHLKFTFAVVVVGLAVDLDYSDFGSENRLPTSWRRLIYATRCNEQ